jgi:hypothetical protein
MTEFDQAFYKERTPAALRQEVLSKEKFDDLNKRAT